MIGSGKAVGDAVEKNKDKADAKQGGGDDQARPNPDDSSGVGGSKAPT